MKKQTCESKTYERDFFLVEDDPEGGYVAQAIGQSIFTQADTIEALKEFVRDAVHCHFPKESDRRRSSKIIRIDTGYT